ncbi:unnamed protein product [Merluccius merluccius]
MDAEVIRPALGHPPTTRNLMKTDPVARYFQYKVEWAKYPVPEGKWRELRSEIRYKVEWAKYPVPEGKWRELRSEIRHKVESAKYPVPGGKRSELRSEIRELLAYQPPPVSTPQARTHLVHRPNDYIVPTDKKRSALRWEIKHNLLPP